MNGLSRHVARLVCGVIAASVSTTARAAAQTRPVDRWLVARAAAPDSAGSDARLASDLLSAPGEAGILPDRGRTAGGVTWNLDRRDGTAVFPLGEEFPELPAGAVVYAHAYVRLPSDRTLLIEWGGNDCTLARAWLNGRELAGSPLSARFGAGWNTLLVKLVTGDCAPGLHASLSAAEAGADGPAWPLDDIRIQASRPPGEVRTGPDDWVVPRDTARIAHLPQWRGDRLWAGLAIGLTSWGRAAVTDVEVELRDGPGGKTVVPWLVPGSTSEAVVPVRLDQLDGLLSVGRVDVRLHWDDEKIDRPVHVAGERPGIDDGVRLAGWKVQRTAGQAERSRDAGRLPNGTGWILQGEWKVPKALAGRSLAVATEEAPATYTLNGRAAPASGGAVTLCDPCREGAKLELTATSAGAWAALPLVRTRPSDAEGS